ncbi:MAG: polysaccharide biosynthesis protein [Lachnospiraceae bacterium]|nr:polysaccharide biosynthesis protein [Lachnospiraceae bacterium]
MKHTNPLVKGALILISAGLVTRVIGFFYRIFLSRTIGAEGLGLYNLIFPVYGIVCALSIAPVQTAISRFVAEEHASKKKGGMVSTLLAGTLLSFSITIILSFLIYFNAEWIAVSFLNENHCIDLLKIMAFSLPFNSIHSCISGYYYGIRKAATPSIAQLTEQIIRVITVYIICTISLANSNSISPSVAVIGIVIGDAASMLYSVISLPFSIKCNVKIAELSKHLHKIFTFSIPLAVNRLFLSILHSIESVLIPIQLRLSGLADSDAISLFGILTGMAMPFIQFPSAIPNAIAVLLLPEVAAASASSENADDQKNSNLFRSSKAGIQYSLLLGILCVGIFSAYGSDMGIIIFNNPTAGTFIEILAWLCPFMYITTTFGSILNGLGETAAPFIHNIISILIRLAFIFFGIPTYGIIAYLYGTLVSQISIALLHYISIRKKVSLNLNALRVIVWPTIILLVSLLVTGTLLTPLESTNIIPLLILVIKCGAAGLMYLILLSVFKLLDINT